MDKTIKAKEMIEYLQGIMDRFMDNMVKYGRDDRMTEKYFDEMIACKEMVEALIGEPVNLRKDGYVTVGWSER